nr:hypothetical protein [Cyanobium sp. PCC 7001]
MAAVAEPRRTVRELQKPPTAHYLMQLLGSVEARWMSCCRLQGWRQKAGEELDQEPLPRSGIPQVVEHLAVPNRGVDQPAQFSPDDWFRTLRVTGFDHPLQCCRTSGTWEVVGIDGVCGPVFWAVRFQAPGAQVEGAVAEHDHWRRNVLQRATTSKASEKRDSALNLPVGAEPESGRALGRVFGGLAQETEHTQCSCPSLIERPGTPVPQGVVVPAEAATIPSDQLVVFRIEDFGCLSFRRCIGSEDAPTSISRGRGAFAPLSTEDLPGPADRKPDPLRSCFDKLGSCVATKACLQ